MAWAGTGIFGLALVMLTTPGVARAADGLDCMAQSYAAEDLAAIEALSTEFSFRDGGDGSEDRLSQIGVAATYRCSEANSWSANQLYYAMLFELGRLSEAAYRRSGHLSAQQLRTIDESLAAREREELWALMERAVLAGLENREAETTASEDLLMGGFLFSLGLGADEAMGEKVGELMGTMALQRIGRREFAALGERE